jgi:hypothetical protein
MSNTLTVTESNAIAECSALAECSAIADCTPERRIQQKRQKYKQLQNQLCELEMEDWYGDDCRIPIIQKEIQIIKAEVSFLQNYRTKSKNWKSIKEI